jgi:hypothetical protein
LARGVPLVLVYQKTINNNRKIQYTETMNHDDVIEFSWTTHEYEHRKKSTDWYWALGIIVIVGSVLAFITGNFLFGFLVLLGGFMVGIFATKKLDPVQVVITKGEIIINKLTIPFSSITGFWMYRNPFGTKKLLFKTTKNFHSTISIPIDEDVSTDELHTFLINYFEEQEIKESFTDIISERIGF